MLGFIDDMFHLGKFHNAVNIERTSYNLLRQFKKKSKFLSAQFRITIPQPSPALCIALEKFLNYLALITRKRPPHAGHFLKRTISINANFQQFPYGPMRSSLHLQLTQ